MDTVGLGDLAPGTHEKFEVDNATFEAQLRGATNRPKLSKKELKDKKRKAKERIGQYKLFAREQKRLREEKSSLTGADEGVEDEDDETVEETVSVEEKEMKHEVVDISMSNENAAKFHLADSDRFDYQGRAWCIPPTDRKPRIWTPEREPYTWLPKKCVHVWDGHSAGVNSITFSPRIGHLLLSGSNDGTVKVWDVFDHRKCIQTYSGHSKAVKEVSFLPDATKFFSASFDQFVNMWDLETGKIIRKMTNKRIPRCVTPHPSIPNVVLCGTTGKTIVQFDTRTGKVEQTYDQHLATVNTVTFTERGKRFVSSSDDKTLRIWEFGIPVTIKYIADPTMNSMPSVSMHGSKKFLLAQSMDNTVMVYDAQDKYRLNRKKIFKGHSSSGFACQVFSSPDGQFVISGDAKGRLFCWDWKNPQNTPTQLQAHDKVTIGCVWHPTETSKVATCSWDGKIKLWD